MKCFYNQAEVSYPCSSGCHLFADCMLEWVKGVEFERAEKALKETVAPSAEEKRETNFDRIMKMNVKEFSKKFFEIFPCENCPEKNFPICKNTCAENFEEWLLSSCED